jgi:ClpA/ClpB-like protein
VSMVPSRSSSNSASREDVAHPSEKRAGRACFTEHPRRVTRAGAPPNTGPLFYRDIAQLLLNWTRQCLKPQGIQLEFTAEAVELLAEEGFEPEFDARPLRRPLQRRVDNELS